MGGFVAGGALFYFVLTLPISRSGSIYNRTYHVIAHPVVLALAVPPNALSRREHIQWLDPVGLDLARTVEPDTSFMGPTYERALWRYYWRLWRQHPGEMMAIYLAKWRLATTGSAWFVDHNMSGTAKHLFVSSRYFESGISFTILFAAMVIIAVCLGGMYCPSVGMLVATIASFGLFIALESAIIFPFFFLPYHNAYLFALFVTNLVCFQIVVNGAWWVVHR